MPHTDVITVEINNQGDFAGDVQRVREAVVAVVSGEGVPSATVSVAIVDDATIQLLNQKFLDHDYATDVLSFLLESEPGRIEGEIIISAETAERVAREFDWTTPDELLLYVVHGALHLVGYDDKHEEDRQQMRERERFYLARFGLRSQDTSGRSHDGDAS